MHVTKLKANKAKCLIKDMTNPDDCLELNPYEKFLQNTEEWTSEGGSFSKGGCNVYGSDIKNCFFYLMSEKNMNALAAAKELNVPMSTAHAWKVAKKASDEGAPIIRKKKGRVPLLSEEHARFLTNLFDKNPSLAIHEVVKSLRDQFADTQISDKTVYYFVTKKCNITLGKAFTRTVERNSPETIEKRYRWAIKQKKTTMNFMDNCVFIDQITTRVRMKTSADLTEKKKAQPPTVIFGAISMYGLVNVFEGSAKSQTTCKKKDVAGDSSRAPKKTQKIFDIKCDALYNRVVVFKPLSSV
ncbi:hypothetical protein BY458DRAFT_546167 [Sporodiniella umbellata]|nr:hypothetical protein BY458DRAFT_546167 [Sporodiniella umbellata]